MQLAFCSTSPSHMAKETEPNWQKIQSRTYPAWYFFVVRKLKPFEHNPLRIGIFGWNKFAVKNSKFTRPERQTWFHGTTRVVYIYIYTYIPFSKCLLVGSLLLDFLELVTFRGTTLQWSRGDLGTCLNVGSDTKTLEHISQPWKHMFFMVHVFVFFALAVYFAPVVGGVVVLAIPCPSNHFIYSGICVHMYKTLSAKWSILLSHRIHRTNIDLPACKPYTSSCRYTEGH